MRKIDISTHILPPKYHELLSKEAPANSDLIQSIRSTPTLVNLDYRFRIMDKFEGLTQVLTITSSALPVREIVSSVKAVDLAKIANDGLAELVLKYPDRFAAAVACLPLNDMEASLRELERAVNDLKLKGVMIPTPLNDKALDSPELFPLYEKMSQYDLPIWIHPVRPSSYADYRTENKSIYSICSVFGWPFETTVAMARIVFSGILEKYPNLKFITHHAGGMVPYFSERIRGSYDRVIMLAQDNVKQRLSKHHIEYFKMFYYDTAVNGNTPALMCAYEFCGADHLLFGTDMPYDTEYGERNLRQVIAGVERMAMSDPEKEQTFVGNARKLLHL